MKSAWLFRIAAVMLILFAGLHTYGFLKFKPPTEEGLAVMESMDRVRFEVKGTSLSYGGFYKGFGLFVSVYLFFSAFLAWYLGGLLPTVPRVAGMLGWLLCAAQVVCAMVGGIYFSATQAAFPGVVAVCLGWAAATSPTSKLS